MTPASKSRRSFRKPNANDDFYFPSGEPRTWKDRFAGKQPVTSAAESQEKDGPVPNCLFVTPPARWFRAKGGGWCSKKICPPGDNASHFPDKVELKIGEVIPFAVSEMRANNGPDEGKRLQINFSKPVSPLLKPADLSKWITITPVPDHLKMAADCDQVTLTGDFKLSERYNRHREIRFPRLGAVHP